MATIDEDDAARGYEWEQSGRLVPGTNRGVCECCGNEYDHAMRITVAGRDHVFDSFECAIAVLAPTCGQCGMRIIGHGVEAEGQTFCCAHCARRAGVARIHDRG